MPNAGGRAKMTVPVADAFRNSEYSGPESGLEKSADIEVAPARGGEVDVTPDHPDQSIRETVEARGGRRNSEQPVIADDDLITSRHPDDAPIFTSAAKA